ncbi:hypothetical protein GCM10017674_78390 [Streptomyces gardneri]|uniref:Uncharacterized protein n=1 Tax=Streptomyces gardneri TaxID=66892 RepID=A0A4Y3RHA1_9ACTN|nr:hypothetical protein SGA01_27860 [Streptomyces gardneri]GHH22541.1 hypothetical protein GCM10017674_78390 [Streptomyces gardneri]
MGVFGHTWVMSHDLRRGGIECMDEVLSPALMVRVALGVVHGAAGEQERETWARLAELVAGGDADPTRLMPAAQRELLEFEASPTSAARAEALIEALESRARRDGAFRRDLISWAHDARQRSYAHDHGDDLRRASLHGSVVQVSPDSLVTFVTYGPSPSRSR